MRIFSDNDILNQSFRKQVIDEIKSDANRARKREALKRQECYRDNTLKYVLKSLEEMGLKGDTIKLMQTHASNISIVKKVVNKKARAYRGSITRSADKEVTTAQVMALAGLLGMNEKFKKADRTTELQNNSIVFCLPEPTPEGKIRLRASVLGPWQYDVIEDGRNPERAACIVLSEFVNEQNQHSYNVGQVQQIDAERSVVGDQIIAAGPGVVETRKGETFIFWTNSYHMTCDENGEIINSVTPIGAVNPIGQIPAVTIDKNQDGQYWGEGGQDLVDGAVLVNIMTTDMNTIMYMQGWGQLVIKGPNIPTNYQIGPHVALTLETREGQTAPDVDMISANPPIEAWLRVIEQYVALLLSTNDLSTSAVQTKLDANSFPSGVAMLIDRSESTASITDRRQTFASGERRFWKIVAAWMGLYASSLDYEFNQIGVLPEDIETSVRYQDEEQITTEKEKLETLKIRREMGLATLRDTLKADNPNMTAEEIEAKIEEIKADLKEFGRMFGTALSQEAARLTEDQEEADGQTTEGGDMGATGNATAGGDVQRLALNGAQVQALVAIIVAVASGEIPKASAPATIQAAFPFMTPEEINRIVAPIVEGSAKPEPQTPPVKETDDA